MAGPDAGDRAARWARAQALFHDALEREAGARDAWLREACGDDAALLADVRALLAADAGAEALPLLDRGLPAVANELLASPDAAKPGRTFGPYRLLELLGEGGMGVVHRARRDDLGSDAAIKILRDASLSPARRERFAFEQRALAQLNHPAIARLYDADTLADGTPWFAMELVDGVPLTEHARAAKLSIDARLKLFREVCEAVQHAHARAILHRDLKPSNILVRPDGRVKLLDFGIAKPLDTLDDPAGMTRTGLRLMTPAYAAPEQVRGEGLGVHTDVYSLGVVLYELLTGRLPFDLSGRTPAEAVRVVETQAPPRPSEFVIGELRTHTTRGPGRASWADLDVLCLTAMHRDPQRRYRTVDALLRDVDHYLAGKPLDARGDPFGYRAGKFARRHAGAIVAATLAVAVIATLVAFDSWRLRSARDHARDESRRKELVQAFMTQLVSGEDESGPSDTLRVVTMIARGEEQARAITGEPALQGELERTLGGLQQSLGHLDRADTLLQHALVHTLAAPRPDPSSVAQTRVAIAVLRTEQGRFDDAEREAREAVSIASRQARAEPERLVEAQSTLGRLLVQRGANAAAVPVLEAAIRLDTRQGAPSREGLIAMTTLANAHYYLGHLAVTDSINRAVLAIDRARLGPRHIDVADDLFNLQQIESDRGHFAAAESLGREALDITRAWCGEDHPKTASALSMVARVYIDEQRYDEAAAILPEALAIQERVYGPWHTSLASTLNALASVASASQHLERADSLYARAAAIYRRAYGDHHGSLAITLGNRGGLWLRVGDARRAEPLLREALEACRGVLADDALDVGIGHIRLGRALKMQRRWAEAERETLAGYRIVRAQADPGISFLRAARTDLVADYEAMGRTADAARFRAELADTAASR